jgi:hypothetical protein
MDDDPLDAEARHAIIHALQRVAYDEAVTTPGSPSPAGRRPLDGERSYAVTGAATSGRNAPAAPRCNAPTRTAAALVGILASPTPPKHHDEGDRTCLVPMSVNAMAMVSSRGTNACAVVTVGGHDVLGVRPSVPIVAVARHCGTPHARRRSPAGAAPTPGARPATTCFIARIAASRGRCLDNGLARQPRPSRRHPRKPPRRRSS